MATKAKKAVKGKAATKVKKTASAPRMTKKANAKKTQKIMKKAKPNKIISPKATKKKSVAKSVKMTKTKTGVQKSVTSKLKTATTKKIPVKKITATPKSQRISVPTKKPQPNKKTKFGTIFGAAEIIPYQEQIGEDYMNHDQRDHFRNLLLLRKKQILEEMDRTVHHLQDEAANFPDPNDRATQEEEFSLELRARDRERKFVKNIEDALTRLDEGSYGYCDSCGVEIGIRRLEARPTATLCIDCKTFDEIKEKQLGG